MFIIKVILANAKQYDGPKKKRRKSSVSPRDKDAKEASAASSLASVSGQGGTPPATPGPSECGVDPTDDGLDCAEYGSCP